MTICTLTDAAKKQIDIICEENKVYAVTLNLKGGGCAGFEYDWGTLKSAEEVKPLDITMDAGIGKFVIGNESMMFLFGTEIDYIKSIIGANFEVRNPNAKSSCGCGISVNFDMDKLATQSAI